MIFIAWWLKHRKKIKIMIDGLKIAINISWTFDNIYMLNNKSKTVISL